MLPINLQCKLYNLPTFVVIHYDRIRDEVRDSIPGGGSSSISSVTMKQRCHDSFLCPGSLAGAHMPVLYGEGDRAFRRLQLEIISQSNDTSIFAWQYTELSHSGLLAYNPSKFKGCGSVVNLPFREKSSPETPAYEIVRSYAKIRIPILDVTDPCFLNTLPGKQILSQILPGRAIKQEECFLMALD